MAATKVEITDEQIDAAIARSQDFEKFPRIVHATYHAGPGLDFLMLKLDTDQRLLIPREQLGELKNATPEQASDVEIGPQGRSVWWPQLDDGLYLPDFLKYRWNKEVQSLGELQYAEAA
jgi:hypothetical protein